MIKNFYYLAGLNILSFILMVGMVLVGVAFLTLLERKILGYVQGRKGPNKVGILGVFQPFSDAMKLYSKEVFIVFKSNVYMYYMVPVFSLALMLLMWVMYPIITNNYLMNYSMLYVIMVMSLGGYTLLMVGWSSNSVYSMIGMLRSVAQALSYEVSFIFIVMVLMILSEGYSVYDFCKYQCYVNFLVFLFPLYLMFFLSVLAELNRSPFDFIEGESELVSGFNVEYFSGGFALIFMAEYGMIIFFSVLMVLMFFGGSSGSLSLIFFYSMLNVCLVIYMRGLLPRMRYDELMSLCWKIILPVALNYLVMIVSFKVLFFLVL